ncbi:hypothetical protein, partial [Pseudomonas sp. HY2-MNA-CIBAN-0224]
LEYLVHTNHPIFEQPHLDKALFYEAFGELDSSLSNKLQQDKASQPLLESSLADSQTEVLACQQMQNKALYATRQLAKRQYTWLRKVMQLPSTATPVAISPNSADDANDSMNHTLEIKAFTTMAEARNYLL